MSRKQKRMLLRIVVTAVVFSVAFGIHCLFSLSPVLKMGLFVVPYILIGWDVLYGALRNIFRGQVFDEKFLMTVATVGAFIIGEYPEGVFVMLFYQTGELFQAVAVGRTRRTIATLSEICPDTVRLVKEEGEEEADAEDVTVGTLIRVLPGERVPIDSVVVSGCSTLDLSALTGESLPKTVKEGSTVDSGAVNNEGVLLLRTVRPFAESTASRILEMVENATDRKARVERFITRFSKVYTPIVCILAVFAAFLPLLWDVSFTQSVYGALSFLVISCPCALVISVPLTFFCAIGGAAKRGILFKGASELEGLARVGAVAFDKTGTLTEGVLRPTHVLPCDRKEKELLTYLMGAESGSLHPVALSLRRAYPDLAEAAAEVREAKTVTGKGVSALVDGKRVLAGRKELLLEEGISLSDGEAQKGVAVYVAVDGKYAGAVFFDDTVKAESKAAVAALAAMGLAPVMMLSGDRRENAERIAAACGIELVHASLLPEEKVAVLEKVQTETAKRFAFVGDGINDSPALAVADSGIAMGALGSDAAVEAADVVILDDAPKKVATAIRHARRTKRIVWQNIFFSLGVKVAVMVLSFLSLTGMWAAVFADVGVSVIAILNAMRAFRMKK